MSVKKIFTLLITVVGCVVVGALVLNILLPNVATTLVNAVEQMVYKATGLDFDWNGDGQKGSSTGFGGTQSATGDESQTGVGVDGFSTN